METTKAKMNWAHTRRTLLERLRRTRTDEAGWYDFFDTYSRLIYSVARKSGLGHSDAEDMVQSTTLKVAQYIQRFENMSCALNRRWRNDRSCGAATHRGTSTIFNYRKPHTRKRS